MTKTNPKVQTLIDAIPYLKKILWKNNSYKIWWKCTNKR